MPEGRWSFLNSSGPKRQVNAAVAADAELVLRAVAAMYDVRPSTLAGVILTGWARDYLEAHADELSEFTAEERARLAREASAVDAGTATGRSVQKKRPKSTRE